MRSHRRPVPDFLPSGTTVFGRFRSTDTEKRMFFREISGRFFDAAGRTGRCKWRNPTVRAVRICGSDSNSRKKRQPISAAVSDEMSYSAGCVRRILVLKRTFVASLMRLYITVCTFGRKNSEKMFPKYLERNFKSLYICTR